MSVQHGGVRSDALQEPIMLKLYNSTGAALVKGDVAAMNFDFVNTTVDNFDPSAPTTNLIEHAIAVTTENMARVLVVAAESVAVDALGNFYLKGFYIDVNVTGDTNKGEYLSGTNASDGATPLTLTEVDALTSDVGIVGIALETRTGAGTVKAWFDGCAWKTLAGNVS